MAVATGWVSPNCILASLASTRPGPTSTRAGRFAWHSWARPSANRTVWLVCRNQ